MTDIVETSAMADDIIMRAGASDEGWTYLEQLLGFESTSATSVHDALKQPEIAACVDVISQDIAKAGIQLRRRLKGGGEQIVHPTDHPIARFLALEPNQYHTWFEFTQMMVSHMVLVQNAFILKETDRKGKLLALYPITPGYTTVLVDEKDGDLYYRVTAGTNFQRAMLKGVSTTLRSDQMIHIRSRMWDGLFGLSSLSLGSESMALAKSVTDYQKNLYQNFGQTRGVFQTEQAFSGKTGDEAFVRLKKQLTERMRKVREEAAPVLLEAGLKFSSVSMNANDAEVSKARASTILDTARRFRVPPHKIMYVDGMKYENLDAMEKQYVGDTLWPTCQAIESQLSKTLLTENERLEYYFWIDRDALQMSDPKSFLEETKMLMHNSLATIDQARARHNLNPLENSQGEMRMIPVNMALIDKEGKITVLSSNAKPGGQEGADPSTEPGTATSKEFPALKVVK
jgi:HK97 family phage portal protein